MVCFADALTLQPQSSAKQIMLTPQNLSQGDLQRELSDLEHEMHVHSLMAFTHTQLLLTSATSFWKVSVSWDRPKLKGPCLFGIMESHCRSRGMETLKGRFPMMWKLGGSASMCTHVCVCVCVCVWVCVLEMRDKLLN